MNYILFPKQTEVNKIYVGLVNKNKYEWEREVRNNITEICFPIIWEKREMDKKKVIFRKRDLHWNTRIQ